MKNHSLVPTLIPAAFLALGAWTAPRLVYISIPLLAALAVFALGLGRLGRRAGVAIAFLAFGMIAAVLRLDLPRSSKLGPDRGRPVEALVQVAGHWSGDEGGWSAPARVLRLRQGAEVAAPPLEISLFLPGTEEPPLYGSTLRLRGYLTRSAGFANRIPVPPGPWRLRIKSRALMEVEAPPGRLDRLSGNLRSQVDAAYRAAGPESSGRRRGKALARALVLGDVSDLPLEWKRSLRVTGLYHLMSVSGVHLALAAGAVWLLGGWLPRSLRLLCMLAAIGFYLLLVGPLPALVRAAVMSVLTVLALLAERPPASANALGWAVILLILEGPQLVDHPAFQLTVSATAGILALAPALVRRWSRLPHGLATSLAASVGAQLLTLPWVLPRFHLLSPAAPLLNFVAVPWTGVALMASLLWTGIAAVSPRLAGTLLPVLDALAAPFSWPSRVPPEIWGTLPIHASPLLAWTIAALLAVLLLAGRWRAAMAAAGLAAIAGAIWIGSPRRGLELAMLDVGQGDAILLRDGSRAVLVDGGGRDGSDLGGRALLPALLAEGVRSLDSLVMSHPDADHCAGLADIAAYLPVKEVWMGPGWDASGCAGRLAALPGTRTRFLWAGKRARVGRWRLTVLHPEREEQRGENERSLVLLAEAHGRRILLTGDIESWAEARLLSCCGQELRTDLLKVAHHGSKTSSTQPFLAAARPRLALISAGVNNLYHHPSPVVLDRLAEHGARVLRTDRDGMILVRLSERGMRIELPGSPR